MDYVRLHSCGPFLFGTPQEAYILLDMCPDPMCQTPTVTKPVCGQNAYGMWPCGGGGGSVFDCSYPNSPLVLCGLLQVISNLLDVFASFIAIFNQPILIPSNSDKRRGILETIQNSERMIGPVRRESVQTFKARFQGTVYGLDTGAPNYVESAASALYDYDTSDCYHDPITCVCRNLDMSEHCYIDPKTGELQIVPNKKRYSLSMETSDITSITASDKFNGFFLFLRKVFFLKIKRN